jgi:hypothetical protein
MANYPSNTCVTSVIVVEGPTIHFCILWYVFWVHIFNSLLYLGYILGAFQKNKIHNVPVNFIMFASKSIQIVWSVWIKIGMVDLN